MQKLQAIILAAGKGTRMQHDTPKPLIPVNGVPMLTKVLTALEASEVAEPPVMVVGGWTTAIQDHYGPVYQYAIQSELNGTGGAVAAALPLLASHDTAAPVLILYADHPFISPHSLQKIATTMMTTNAMVTMYTVTVPDFTEWRQPFLSFGRIIRDTSGNIQQIVEYKNATYSERAVTEVNPALYCVNAAWLAEVVPQIPHNVLTGECYLTDIVAFATTAGHSVCTIPLPAAEALGLNSFADIENAKQVTQGM